MITPVSPTFLKQEAKKLKRSHKLLMSKALDEVSKIYGFSNYRHYLNVYESNLQQSKDSTKYLEYFKLQAKNLFEDYKTKTPYYDNLIDDYLYEYSPEYFDIEEIICSYDVDEENFSLKEAQSIIADMSGFNKWTALLKALESELELAKLLFDNRDIIDIENWQMYISKAEDDNDTTFDSEDMIEIFKHTFLNEEI